MRLLSTFHFAVLFVVSICFIFGNVEGEKVREYTVAFQGSNEEAEIIIKEQPESPPPKQQHPHAPPSGVRIHPIHEAREFLGEHNKIRKELGEPLMKWDKTLAHYARRFAGKRAVNCDMIHSLGPYGENIYWGADYSKHTAAVAVRAWAGETNNYNPMKNTCDPLKSCGHYKQMVWKTSTKLGCARAKCNSGGVYIICSYDPPGNYFGESPFDTPPSSETPSTPTLDQTKTPTPTSAQTKTPISAQTKTPTPDSVQTKTPTSAQTKTPTPDSVQRKTPTSAQTKTPTSAQTKTTTPTPTSAHTKTPNSASTKISTSAQTKTPTPTSAQTKTPASAQTKTPTSAQTKTPTPTSTHTKTPASAHTKTPTSAQTKTPTPTSALTQTKTPTSAQTKTPTSAQTPTTPSGAKTKPTSPSSPS